MSIFFRTFAPQKKFKTVDNMGDIFILFVVILVFRMAWEMTKELYDVDNSTWYENFFHYCISFITLVLLTLGLVFVCFKYAVYTLLVIGGIAVIVGIISLFYETETYEG